MRRVLTLLVLALTINLVAPAGAIFASESSPDDLVQSEPETMAEIEASSIPVVLSGTVVISQTLLGTQNQPRLVEIYNNSDIDIDMDGWCIWYNASTTTFASGSKRGCISIDELGYRVILPARTHAIFSENDLSGGLGAGSKGRLYITDKSQNVIDFISWNTVVDESNPFIVAGGGAHIFGRKMIDNLVYQDTDSSSEDMFLSSLREPPYEGGLTEMLDVCSNIAGLQSVIPVGYERSDSLICFVPVPTVMCLNLPEMQIDNALSSGYEVDDEGNCYRDVCLNIAGFQGVPPNDYYEVNGRCEQEIMPLQVTELLPNPDGVDKGSEFIEIFNPNSHDVELWNWNFYLNDDYQKVYSFPIDSIAPANGYYVLWNSQVAYTLTNNTGSLRLNSIDNHYLVDVPRWENAKDGHSWSLIGGQWQFSSLITPGSKNKLPEIADKITTNLVLDCGEGRERNPLTGRCRNIPVEKELALCKDGQYRNEETGRCRSIALAVSSLKPCADDQFRNPQTNRCKKIASADDVTLADCGEGRERNPETNRCRNVLAVSTTKLPFAPENVTQVASATWGWWVFGGVSLLALGYAGWQWRWEVGRIARQVRSTFSPKNK